jgi:hypothetical protein
VPESQQLQPFAEVAAVLFELCHQRRTGYLFLATEQNHTASIGITDGTICALHYRIRKGLAALEDIRAIEAARYRFEVKDAVPVDDTLPGTDYLFDALGIDAPPGHSERSPARRSDIPGSLLKQVNVALTEVIGPMASVISQAALEQASSYEELIDIIAGKIPDRSAAAQFRAAVTGRR